MVNDFKNKFPELKIIFHPFNKFSSSENRLTEQITMSCVSDVSTCQLSLFPYKPERITEALSEMTFAKVEMF